MAVTAIDLNLEGDDLVFYSGQRVKGALVVQISLPVIIAGEIVRYWRKGVIGAGESGRYKIIKKGLMRCELDQLYSSTIGAAHSSHHPLVHFKIPLFFKT